MKIQMRSYEFPPLGGGGSRAVHGLSRALLRQGLDVDLITMHARGLPRREVVDGVRVRRLPCVRLRPSLCTVPELAIYDASAALDVLRRENGRYPLSHAHFIFPDGLVALWAKRYWGVPYVITSHGSDVPGYNPDRFTLVHRLLQPLWQRVVREAAEIVCPSETLRTLIQVRAPHARTSVIPYGFDADRFRTDRCRLRRILVVSRLLARKGVQYVIEALRQGDGDGWELHVVGEGPHESELKRAAAGSRTPVRFHGWLDNDSDELRELYETSSMFVLPSESENFPMVLLEAMAAGLPVVTSLGTGTAEVVGNTGLLVEPRDPRNIRDAIEALQTDDALRAELGTAARKRIETELGWDAVARKHLELYRRHALDAEHGNGERRVA